MSSPSFTAFGTGSLLLQAALPLGFSTTLAIFGLAALTAAALAVHLFAAERPTSPTASE